MDSWILCSLSYFHKYNIWLPISITSSLSSVSYELSLLVLVSNNIDLLFSIVSSLSMLQTLFVILIHHNPSLQYSTFYCICHSCTSINHYSTIPVLWINTIWWSNHKNISLVLYSHSLYGIVMNCCSNSSIISIKCVWIYYSEQSHSIHSPSSQLMIVSNTSI